MPEETKQGGAAMDGTPNDAGGPSDYRSFLLRLWREGGADQPWRASLEMPVTGERRGFASVDALFDFVRLQLAAPADGAASVAYGEEVMTQRSKQSLKA
jgi:hypothetical protein